MSAAKPQNHSSRSYFAQGRRTACAATSKAWDFSSTATTRPPQAMLRKETSAKTTVLEAYLRDFKNKTYDDGSQ